MRFGRWTIVAVLVGLALLAAGCSDPQPWKTKDISGLMPDLSFHLTDDTGQSVRAKDYRGKVVLMYFGYTHCPDVCPTTLARLSQAIDQLGSRARDVRVLFVTVDPARDHLAVLKRYANAFGPDFVGMRGTDDALRALTKRYRVTYGRGKPDADGNYEVSHSSAVFVFDGSGKVRLMVRQQDAPDAIAADLKRLLSES